MVAELVVPMVVGVPSSTALAMRCRRSRAVLVVAGSPSSRVMVALVVVVAELVVPPVAGVPGPSPFRGYPGAGVRS